MLPQHPSCDPDADLVYEVDSGLRLVAWNEPWARFARENGGDPSAGLRRSVLDSFSGSARARWEGIYRKLLSEELPEHSERFSCPSPTARRTFRLTIRPRHDPAGRVTGLVHRTAILDQRPARRADRRPGRLRGGCLAVAGPGDAAIRLAGFRRPLCGEGGDLIWDRRLDGGVRDVVLADVMGHDALSARVARMIRSVLNGLPADRPGECVRQLNEELVGLLPGIHPETMFATGLYLQVDPGARKLRVSNFAHFGLLFSERGVIDPPGGLPVGMFPSEGPWPEIELDFGGLGRRLLAYTDGIVEQFDPAGAMFGTLGLLREFRDALGVDLEAGLTRIMAGVDAFRGDALVKDDQSLLAVELD